MKKRASKAAHNRPKLFFHSTGPTAQTSPELIFHIINMSQDSSVSLSVSFPLPKNSAKNYLGVLHPVNGIDKINIGTYWKLEKLHSYKN